MDKKTLIGVGLTTLGVLIAFWAMNNVGPVNAVVSKKA